MATAIFVKLMQTPQLIHHGAFGQAVHDWHESHAVADAVTAHEASHCMFLVMGQADLPLLRETAETMQLPLVAAFLCGRYLVVTPRFEPGQPCAGCFTRRLVSSPPPGMHSEAVLALTTMAGVGSGFDPVAFAPSLIPIALSLLQHQSNTPTHHAILVDQAGSGHFNAPLVAIHGCACRGAVAGRNRFTDFRTELFA